ncbi:MAG: hypothetical protein V9E83_06965 [Baekduia sp.]
MSARLDPADLEALADLIADRLAEHLAPPTNGDRLVDAATVAAALGVTAGHVRENAERYGGRRIGDGPRPRLRFDLAVALAVGAAPASVPAQPPAPPPARPARRRARPSAVDLLPIGGRQ